MVLCTKVGWTYDIVVGNATCIYRYEIIMNLPKDYEFSQVHLLVKIVMGTKCQDCCTLCKHKTTHFMQKISSFGSGLWAKLVWVWGKHSLTFLYWMYLHIFTNPLRDTQVCATICEQMFLKGYFSHVFVQFQSTFINIHIFKYSTFINMLVIAEYNIFCDWRKI